LAFVAQRVGADYLGSFTFNGVRFLLGAISLTPVIFILERDAGSFKDNKLTFYTGIGAGLFIFFGASLQQFGILFTGSAGRAGFITGLYTVLVPMLGILFGRKPGILTWAGAVFAVFGLYLLAHTSGDIMIGDIVLFIGAFFWAGHIIFVDWFASRIKPIRFSVTQFATCGILSMACAFIFEEVAFSGIAAGLAPILYSGILSVGIAYTLQIVGQKGVEPAKAAIIFSLEALFSAIGGAILLGETMSFRGYAGCTFIFLGIIASQITVKKFAVSQRR
jgi:drug/metabolite transporter (DMT)-like permease